MLRSRGIVRGQSKGPMARAVSALKRIVSPSSGSGSGSGGSGGGSTVQHYTHPPLYALWSVPVTPGQAVAVALDVGGEWGGNYSAVRVDLTDGSDGTILGPILATAEVDTFTPHYDYTVVADGSRTAYMSNVGTVTPSGSSLGILITNYVGGQSNQMALALVSVTPSGGSASFYGVTDPTFSINASGFNTSGGDYTGTYRFIQVGYGQSPPPLSVGGPIPIG